jgi:cytoskeletal protein CcmA (bactofilin family)
MITENISLIYGGVKIEGKLNFPGSVKVDGEITGDINCEEAITIGKNAKVESKVQTKDALVLGNYEGEMHATGQVEITSTGRFIGNLIQDKNLLIIEKGGLFKGKRINSNNEEKKIKKK